MRTNIVIDDKLIRQAMRATGLKTKRAVVEEGLRLLIQGNHTGLPLRGRTSAALFDYSKKFKHERRGSVTNAKKWVRRVEMRIAEWA